MLAYVFWHWRRPDVSAADYETAQRRFHTALAAAPPSGFDRSFSVAVMGAPWAGGGGEAYEDWYLMDGSAALDPLNAAAVSASRQAPHDAAAALAAGGTAGLYSLRLGAAGAPPRTANWFAKPAGMTYGELFAALSPLVSDGRAALWGRQMTLGPALEFCLHSAGPVVLPAPLTPFSLVCRTVWQG
jgi:hypothetical protein